MKKKNVKTSDDQYTWRFWPIICLTIIYPMNNAIVGLAIPLYFFKQGLNIVIIGFLTAGAAITYSFSPLLFLRLSEKLGRKKSIIMAMAGATIAQFTFYITLNPLIFFIARLTEGLFLGFFWANIQSSISDNAFQDHNKYMARFNLSWNSGILIGMLIGTIILFYISDVKVLFYLLPLLVLINTFIAILFFQESVKLDNNINDNKPLKQQEITIIKKERDLENLHIPLLMPLLILFIFALTRASVSFLYPIKSEILEFKIHTVYLMSFLAFLTQLIFTPITSTISLKFLKYISIMAMALLFIILLLFGLFTDFFLFLFLFLLMGACTGILYGTSLKLMITLNIRNNTSKYTSIFESFLGLMFLMVPIISGYLAVIGISFAFFLMSFFILISLPINLICLKRLQNIE